MSEIQGEQVTETATRTNPEQLRAELNSLLGHRFYEPFLKHYVETQPEAAAQLKAVLTGKPANSPEAVAAVEGVQNSMNEILNQVKESTGQLLENRDRYYARATDFWDQFAVSHLGNLVDLHVQLQSPSPDPNRLEAALAVCDEQFNTWLERQPLAMLSNFIDEPAMPAEFWEQYSQKEPEQLRAFVRVLFDQRTGAAFSPAKAAVEESAVVFFAEKIKEDYTNSDMAEGDRVTESQMVNEWVAQKDLNALRGAYEALYVSFEASPPEPAAETSAGVEKPASSVAPRAAAEKTPDVDVRKDAREHSEKYMGTGGTKDKFVFDVVKGSKADLLVRIEDLYSTEADRALTLVSSRYPGKQFAFDAARGSFYEKKDSGFGEQRLAIRAGDQIETNTVAVVAAPAAQPAPAAEVAPAIDSAEATKKALTLANTIHALRGTAEAKVRALDAAGVTRDRDPKAWQEVDSTYAAIAKLYADPGFDLGKLPQNTEDKQLLVAEMTALQNQMESRVAALGAPDAVRNDVKVAMDTSKKPSAKDKTATVDGADEPAPTSDVG